ncbi:glycosyltransferase family 2 protein [Sphaerisporangium rubeum]|uniref:Glycosyltransferase involved in cell wall biosynthesis n=1 Tax=Sphaerisporangium rubeum TaxID=321317 RepID=A0A7X0IFX5_9ACTN|nr:glycosyltransferase [Sphaerisporangium rubeum]MBB6472962.1 glycosyltransferase involved in cell wall biosynthesis [Sphaerisporangium rubeum]
MKISVLTPTYNRAHLLPRLYRSLTAQNADLEWVVVDDGSTDDTPDVLAELGAQAPFPVVHVRQERNAGKHVAYNRAVREASGDLAGVVDSDDRLLPDALATVGKEWKDIPAGSRELFSGVGGRCVTEDGLVGRPFAGGAPYLDGTWHELFYTHDRWEERVRFDRLEVLRRHLFPETGTPSFLPESLVWRQVGGMLRYLDVPLRFYHLEGEDRLCRRPFADMAAGRRVFYATVLNEDLHRWWPYARARFAKWAAQYVRSGLHLGIPPVRQLRDLENRRARLLAAAALPLGTALFLADRRAGPD